MGTILQYVKGFSVKHRALVRMMSVDDHAIIPVGKSSCPVSTGVRGHNRSLVPLDGTQNGALDHNFHLHGIVPSVSFIVDIPTVYLQKILSSNVLLSRAKFHSLLVH